MRVAHAISSFGDSGRQTNTLRRLGVSDTPVTREGPTMANSRRWGTVVTPDTPLPIWVSAKRGPYAGYGTVGNARAVAAGLTYRPFETTVADLMQWFHALPAERQAKLRAGLTREEEAELLKAWHAREGAKQA